VTRAVVRPLRAVHGRVGRRDRRLSPAPVNGLDPRARRVLALSDPQEVTRAVSHRSSAFRSLSSWGLDAVGERTMRAVDAYPQEVYFNRAEALEAAGVRS
jgi:hypothetical protein